MLFSVIVPAYNREHLLAATLESALAQRFSGYEIIVVDDGSTDGTARVAERYGQRIRLLRLPHNSGLCAARNEGLALARGEYCAFLDSDDLWTPWVLECYDLAIRHFRGPAIVSCDGIVGIRGAEDMRRLKEMPLTASCFRDYLAYRSRNAQKLLLLTGMAIRTDLLRYIAGFREQFRAFSEDQDLWLRLGTARGFVRVTQPLCWGYRDHVGNVSKDIARQFEGGNALVRAEQQGDYPGGVRRRRERRKILTMMTRYMARAALQRRYMAAGWDLYRKTCNWNVLLGRWRFLIAYPVLAAVALLRQAVCPGSSRVAETPAKPLLPSAGDHQGSAASALPVTPGARQ